MDRNYKEVYFHEYCCKCEFENHEPDPESDKVDVCNDCLNNPCNENSHKPVNFKEKENA